MNLEFIHTMPTPELIKSSVGVHRAPKTATMVVLEDMFPELLHSNISPNYSFMLVKVEKEMVTNVPLMVAEAVLFMIHPALKSIVFSATQVEVLQTFD